MGLTPATTPSAVGASMALLRAQQAEQQHGHTWDRVQRGGDLPDGLDIERVMVALHVAQVDRAIAEYLLARVPAANDPGGLGPRAA